MEDKEYWLLFFCVVLLLDKRLMLAEEFWVKLDITRLVDTMDVTEASSDAEVGRNLGEGSPNVVDVFRLGVERVVVDIFVVDTVLFATSDANFLSNRINPGLVGRGYGRTYHLEPLLHWCSTLQVFGCGLNVPIDSLF
jgi:hypothetical protein